MWFVLALGSAVFAALTSILAFVILHEKFTMKSATGAALITIGTLVTVL